MNKLQKYGYLYFENIGFVINGSALGVREGFRRTKLSTYHKTPIEKLNLNLTTSPRMTPNACYQLAFLSTVPVNHWRC